ncbi:MAG: hypothetical protein GX885_09615, partial [Methanomicrobiales archaeon]|nr:hypothetical protein [Methanomicrobiales archaeon]
PRYDLLKFLAISDFMPDAIDKICLEQVQTLSLSRTGMLVSKPFEIFVEAVVGSFNGTVGVTDQIAAAAAHNREYQNLGQKLEILGMKDPGDRDSVIPHLKSVLRDFNRWCFEREQRLTDNSSDGDIIKEMNRIERLFNREDLIRVGFGVGTTYQTLFGLIEENDPDLAAHIASQIGRHRRTVGAGELLDPPYPKTIELTTTGYSLGWLEW